MSATFLTTVLSPAPVLVAQTEMTGTLACSIVVQGSQRPKFDVYYL
jgi:hypothetical protein